MTLEKIRSCLWKLEPGFQTYGFICLLGPSFPKIVFRPQTPNVRVFGSKKHFISTSINLCMKQTLIFKFWVNFHKVMSDYSQKLQKTHQKSSFGAIPDKKILYKTCLKIQPPFFGALKSEYLRNRLAKLKKISQFWNPLIKGFQMM